MFEFLQAKVARIFLGVPAINDRKCHIYIGKSGIKHRSFRLLLESDFYCKERVTSPTHLEKLKLD